MKKSTKLAHTHHKMRTVSLFGVSLFIISLIVQLILGGLNIWRYYMLDATKLVNAYGMLGMIMVAALVPPLAAFLIGDSSTTKRSRYEHFYNGVLFAFMTTWIAMFLSFYIMPSGAHLSGIYASIGQFMPAIFALVIATVIGINYGFKRHQKLLHEYRPFQIALIVPLLALIAGTGWSDLATLANPLPSVYGVSLLIPLILDILLLVVSYYLSAEKRMMDKLTDACIATSIGMFASMAAAQIPYYGFGILTELLAPSLIGVLVWLAFLYLYAYRKTDNLE